MNWKDFGLNKKCQKIKGKKTQKNKPNPKKKTKNPQKIQKPDQHKTKAKINKPQKTHKIKKKPWGACKKKHW